MDVRTELQQAADFWKEKDRAMVALPEKELWAEVDAYLEGHRVCVLATGAESTLRCTPLEYRWADGALWIFSEGGEKFRNLARSEAAAVAVFDPVFQFGHTKGLQMTGKATVVPLYSEGYLKAAGRLGLTKEKLERLPTPLHLICFKPDSLVFLNGEFRQKGVGVRQHWERADA